MLCPYRYPDPARGYLHGIPLSAHFCCLQSGHEGDHTNPLIPDSDQAQWMQLTPEQRAILRDDAIKRNE